MAGKTLKCIKAFFVFEEGQSYYCFAEEEGHIWVWLPDGYCGVNQIQVKKQIAKNNFTIRD